MPVPSNFTPTNVISLEPSGTKFTKKVSIKVPNDNDLPAGTQMAFISLNSSTGKWEIDGKGKVTDDGNSVETNSDSGITHFSIIYAVPLAPLIASVQNPNLLGINASDGGSSAIINSPSFKVYDKDVSPSLYYKSNWANPTAVVSNIFAVPNPDTPRSGVVTGGSKTGGWIKAVNCWEVMWGWQECRSAWLDYVIDNSFKTNWESTNYWIPDKVRSQFFVSNIASNQVDFATENVDSEIQQINGTKITNAAATKIIEQMGIPRSAVVSYAVPLINSETNEYLESGIHPALARFEISLKNLVITTNTMTSNTHIWVDGRLQEVRTQTMTRTGIASQLVSMLPQDVQSDILVQNKTKSSAGRGWHLGGAAKIYNPENSRIMIEEGDGSLSTYALNNVISTLFNANSGNIDLKNGVDLSSWPFAYSGSVDVPAKQSFIAEIDLENGRISNGNALTLPQSSGKLPSQGWYSCKRNAENNFIGNFSSVRYPFVSKFTPGGIARTSNGEFFVTHAKESMLIRSGETLPLLGDKELPYYSTQERIEYYPGWFAVGYFNRPPETVQEFCTERFGYPCGPGEPQSQNVACNYYGAPFMITDKGEGSLGYAGLTLNNPTAVVFSPSGKLIIADTGNNRIVSYDINTRQQVVVAGTGANSDLGDGGHAIQASIYHPKGLAYDSSGNLYISSENGLIRKVTPGGAISKFAGGTGVGDQVAISTLMLNDPRGMYFDSANNYLYVADTGNNRVMQLDLKTGIANRVAGSGACSALDGDGGSALLASLCAPTHVGVDNLNNLIVVDSGHSKIRRVAFTRPQGGALSFASSNGDQSILTKSLDGMWSRIRRDGSIETFNSSGNQIIFENTLKQKTSYSYNVDNGLEKILFPSGQSINYEYSGNGKLKSITDSAGRKTTLFYDGDNLTEVRFPDGTDKKFEYDSKGQMVASVDQLGEVTEYAYNEWHRLHRVTKPDGSSEVINDIASQTIANNYSNGVVGEMQSPGYGGEGKSFKVTNANNVTTSMTADHMGYISSVRDALGRETKIERDLYGRPTKVEKADGSKISVVYDQLTGDMLSTKDELSGAIETRRYDASGRVVLHTDANGNQFENKFDSSTGLLIEAKFPAGISETYQYEARGLVTQKTLRNGSTFQTIQFEYDGMGRLNRMIDSSGKYVKYESDVFGNKLKEIVVAANGQELLTSYTYNVMNKLTSVKQSNGDVTSYQYSARGQLISIVDAKGKITNFEYDRVGNLSKKIESNNAEYTFKYDSLGQRIEEADPNGNTKYFQYDSVNQLAKVQFSDDILTYEYDGGGRVKKVSNNTSTLDSIYDSQGNVITSTLSGKGVLSSYPAVALNYNYDLLGNRISLQSSLGTISYTYDSNSRLQTIVNSWGDSFGYSYDALGRLAQLTRNGGYTKYEYNTSSLVSQISHYGGSVQKDFTALSYDSRTFPTSKRNPSGQIDYGYDPNGQLTSANASYRGLESFSYNEVGDRVSDGGGTYQYDESSQRLTDDYRFSYQYDFIGNLVLRQAKDSSVDESIRYSYDSKNQLVQVQIYKNLMASPTRVVSFRYDVLGRRVSKEVVDSTALGDVGKTFKRYYVYDGANILAEYGNSQLLVRYTHNMRSVDDILGANITTAGVAAKISQNAGSYYYQKDHLGSITSISNGSGSIIQRYDYKGFGQLVSVKSDAGSDISANPFFNNIFLFGGREYDAETGLYYHRARYYDPQIGRFIQVDPYAGNMAHPSSVVNKYIYGANRPTVFTDPSGRWIFVGILIAGLIGGIVGGINAKDGEFWQGFGNGALIGMGGAAATIATAGLFTYVGGVGLGLNVAAGSGWGMFFGALGGAVGNGLFAKAMGASGTGLAIAIVAGAISGGVASVYGGNPGQGGTIVSSAEDAAATITDSLKGGAYPVDTTLDPLSYVNDMYYQAPDGSWSNGLTVPSSPVPVLGPLPPNNGINLSPAN
ncbi:RHS repeat-associated core domain-containing protein [Bdellovibrio sp. HCB274]|uniref:RHS repeat-associated core domain-containing protein n=1 Tax=Bdellovibrio sp. HCB274 TaxID=3394361 RepID=UPI0039B44BCC